MANKLRPLICVFDPKLLSRINGRTSNTGIFSLLPGTIDVTSQLNKSIMIKNEYEQQTKHGEGLKETHTELESWEFFSAQKFDYSYEQHRGSFNM